MKHKKMLMKSSSQDYSYVIAKEEPLSFVTESIQKTIINLEYMNVDENLKTLQFTSTLAAEGKTTTISNIAYLLGRKNKKVIMIDLDLRKPKMHKIFKAPNENGITDYLSNKITLEKTINRSEELGVDYILSGEKTSAITNILESDKLKELIKTLKEQYDYILVDSPPVLAVSDALFISKVVDGIIYIVAHNYAKKTEVKEAVKTLNLTGGNILGTIITQVEMKFKNYYYHYEYK